jgi:hypothetical protein
MLMGAGRKAKIADWNEMPKFMARFLLILDSYRKFDKWPSRWTETPAPGGDLPRIWRKEKNPATSQGFMPSLRRGRALTQGVK